MSVFAIQVATGSEIWVKDLLTQTLNRVGNRWVKEIHAFETFTQKFSGKSTAPKQFKSAVPGYIFIEIKYPDFYYMPPDLWHLVKSIPKVFKILKDAIPMDEFETFFKSVDIEPNFEVSLKEKVKTETEMDIENSNLLHRANTTDVKESKRCLEQLGTVEHSTVNEVEIQKQHVASIKNDSVRMMIEKAKAVIKARKHTFNFPFSLFLKTRANIDPENKMSVKQLTNGDFIIPALLKTLREEVSRWKE